MNDQGKAADTPWTGANTPERQEYAARYGIDGLMARDAESGAYPELVLTKSGTPKTTHTVRSRSEMEQRIREHRRAVADCLSHRDREDEQRFQDLCQEIRDYWRLRELGDKT